MRHLVVTGGASAIGAAVAARAEEAGMLVSVLDLAPPPAGWERAGPRRGTWSSLDVADPAAVSAAIGRAMGTAPITDLVACAGVSLKHAFLDTDPVDWSHTFAINVVGTMAVAQAVARAMRDTRSGGAMVLASSTAAAGSVPGLSAEYHASKGAISALTRALAAELAGHGIRVNAVAPGVVSTPITVEVRAVQGEDRLASRVPLGRIADPDDVADVALFLLSGAAGMITGQIVPVDAGQSAVAAAPREGFPVSSRKI